MLTPGCLTSSACTSLLTRWRREGGVGESKRKTWADPLGLLTPAFSDTFALDSRTSVLTVVVFLLFPYRPLWNHSRATGNNTGTKPQNWASTGEEETTLSFRIRQLPSKLYQTPALPSLCRNVSFNTGEFYDRTSPLSQWHQGTKTSGDPVGHLLDSPPRCTLWAWHNFPVRRHGSLCRCVFVSWNKAWKRKESHPDSFSETLSLRPFILLAGVCFVGRAIVVVLEKETLKKASCN